MACIMNLAWGHGGFHLSSPFLIHFLIPVSRPTCEEQVEAALSSLSRHFYYGTFIPFPGNRDGVTGLLREARRYKPHTGGREGGGNVALSRMIGLGAVVGVGVEREVAVVLGRSCERRKMMERVLSVWTAATRGF